MYNCLLFYDLVLLSFVYTQCTTLYQLVIAWWFLAWRRVIKSYHYLHHYYLYFDFLFSHIDTPGGSPHGWGFEITLRHTTLHRAPLEEMISPTQRPLPDKTQHSQETDIHSTGGIRTGYPSKRSAEKPRLRPHGHFSDLLLPHSLGLQISKPRKFCAPNLCKTSSDTHISSPNFEYFTNLHLFISYLRWGGLNVFIYLYFFEFLQSCIFFEICIICALKWKR